VFTFELGATVTQIVDAVNLVSDATGVEATDNGGTLELDSVDYGTAAFVDVEVIEEGALGTFEAGLSATRVEGTDVVATVNGVTANGAGNTLSINTSTLDLSLTVEDGSTTQVDFSIDGGGALFQLGPNVVSNQQARIGIRSINTGVLGGVDGRLYELRSGNDSDLSTDPRNATLIVDAAINKVTSLRGRLGAFQRTTLETNIASLSDTITNLTEAESSIRDADFAAETARLTRAQILVQSGTAVLQIANSNPQNVLALLRG
jgi:flagellin